MKKLTSLFLVLMLVLSIFCGALVACDGAEKVKITFDANGGTLEGRATVKVEVGGFITKSPTATKDGFTFTGWFTAAEGGDEIDFETYEVEEDITLYAQYVQEGTTPGGDDPVVPGDDPVVPGDDPVVPGDDIPTTFDGVLPSGVIIIEAETATLSPDSSVSNYPRTESKANNSGGAIVGYMSTNGNKLSLTIAATAAKKNAKLYINLGSCKTFLSGGIAQGMTLADCNAAYTFTMNGNAFTLIGNDLPDGEGSYNATFVNVLAIVDLVQGNNTLVVEATNGGGCNFDFFAFDADSGVTGGTAGPGDDPVVPGPGDDPVVPGDDPAGTLSAVSANLGIGGYEWGPSIDMFVFELASEIAPSELAASKFSAVQGSTNVTVADAFTCNKDGVKVNAASKYFAVKFLINTASRFNPFTYRNSVNNWSTGNAPQFTISLKSGSTLAVGGTTYTTFNFNQRLTYAQRVVPSTSVYRKDSFTSDGRTLTWGALETDAMKNDGVKNPLIIWLHGQGEGGTDIDISLLGNDVTNLGENTVQKYFTNDTQKGAYVLAVQSPTMWMDSTGNMSFTNNGTSIYGATLIAAIKNYAENLNTDVDLNRIYVGGCSNGGFATLYLMVNSANYFAGFYPVCEAYNDSWISNEKIAEMKDLNVWFTHSANDTTCRPGNSTNATYVRLLNAGAKNVYYSYFQTVKGTDALNNNYQGHFSWIYTLQDQCERVQSTAITATSGLVASDSLRGGDWEVTVNGAKVTLWGWMAAQVKGEQNGSAAQMA